MADLKLSNLNIINSTRIVTSSLINPNKNLNCERNLTKLTVFYSSSDKLTCFEIFTNRSILRCIDDLLETKLVVKLSFFYHVQLQPLFIYKSKMICSYRNGTSLKWNQVKPYLQKVNSFHVANNQRRTNSTRSHSSKQFLTEILSEKNIQNVATTNGYNSTLIKLKNVLGIHKTTEEEYIKSEAYFEKFDPNENLSCTLITKKSSNRKKLIWKLFLTLKNQTCIPLLSETNLPFLAISNEISQSSPFQTPLKEINKKVVEISGISNHKPITVSQDVSKNLSPFKTANENRSLSEEVIKCNTF